MNTIHNAHSLLRGHNLTALIIKFQSLSLSHSRGAFFRFSMAQKNHKTYIIMKERKKKRQKHCDKTWLHVSMPRNRLQAP